MLSQFSGLIESLRPKSVLELHLLFRFFLASIPLFALFLSSFFFGLQHISSIPPEFWQIQHGGWLIYWRHHDIFGAKKKNEMLTCNAAPFPHNAHARTKAYSIIFVRCWYFLLLPVMHSKAQKNREHWECNARLSVVDKNETWAEVVYATCLCLQCATRTHG